MRIFAVGTKIFGGGAWPTFGGPPGPNVEPPLSDRKSIGYLTKDDIADDLQ